MKGFLLVVSSIVVWRVSSDSSLPSSGNCSCGLKTYEADQENGIIKSQNYPQLSYCPGKCVYIIEPHPNKSLSLYYSQFEISKFAVLQLHYMFFDNGRRMFVETDLIKQKKHHTDSSGIEKFNSFTSAKDTGFLISYSSWSKNDPSSFKLLFDRYYDYGELCDKTLVEVSSEETVVQRAHDFSSASGCVYYLKAAHDGRIRSYEDEFLITIYPSEENEVLVKTLNGTAMENHSESSKSYRTIRTSAVQTHIFSFKSDGIDNVFKMAKITAKLVYKDCHCDSTRYEFGVNNLTDFLSIHSPGFPDLYCPEVECNHKITFDWRSVRYPWEPLWEVRVHAKLGSDDNLNISSKYRTYFNNDHHKNLVYNDVFVMREHWLFIHYTSGTKYAARNFEINVTQIGVPRACTCDNSIEQFDSEVWDTITFGEYCTFAFCHYTFIPPENETYAFEYRYTGDIENDVIRIQDDEHIEIIDYDLHSRGGYFETNKTIEVDFYHDARNKTNAKTGWRFNWQPLYKEPTCNGNIQRIEVWNINSNYFVISPGFPKKYHNYQYCQYLVNSPYDDIPIKAQLNHLDVEKYHDYVKIYAGNSTNGKLLYEFTGHIHNRSLGIIDSPIFIVFKSDRSVGDRGFEFIFRMDPEKYYKLIHKYRPQARGDWMDRLNNAILILILVGILVVLIGFGIKILCFPRVNLLNCLRSRNSNREGSVERVQTSWQCSSDTINPFSTTSDNANN